MKFKRNAWLAVVVVSIPLLYLLVISFIPEDKMVGFHWSTIIQYCPLPIRPQLLKLPISLTDGIVK
jgi:hypothetical protein